MLKKITFFAVVGFFAVGATGAVGAEDAKQYSVQDEMTRAECGDCHMVFPPNRLNQEGWRKIMRGLSDHFGEDATIAADKVQHIEDFYTSKAWDAKETYPSKLRAKAWIKKGVIDPIRITETPEWNHEHSKPSYKQMVKGTGYDRGANCIKCHKDAEYGRYEEFGK